MTLERVVDFTLPLVCAAALIAGCCRQAVRIHEPEPRPTEWCAVVEVQNRGRLVIGRACAEAEVDCRDAVATARRFGAMAGVRSVGECRRVR